MTGYCVSDVAAVVGGALSGSGAAAVTGVVIDSRKTQRGSLFAALPGERVDGHDVHVLEEAFRKALEHKGSPSVIIADTVKGKGVSFMENDILWHYRTPQGEEYEAARLELEAQRP